MNNPETHVASALFYGSQRLEHTVLNVKKFWGVVLPCLQYHKLYTLNGMNTVSDTYSLLPIAYCGLFLGGKRGVKVKMTAGFAADITSISHISHAEYIHCQCDSLCIGLAGIWKTTKNSAMKGSVPAQIHTKHLLKMSLVKGQS
jgi:hypothetical protein